MVFLLCDLAILCGSILTGSSDEWPSYIGLTNTTLGIVTFLPVLGGWLVARIGYNGTFVASLVFALIGLLASAQLGEPRARRVG